MNYFPPPFPCVQYLILFFFSFFFPLLSYSPLMRDPLSPEAPQHCPGAPGRAGGGGAAPDPFAAEEQVEQEVPETRGLLKLCRACFPDALRSPLCA